MTQPVFQTVISLVCVLEDHTPGWQVDTIGQGGCGTEHRYHTYNNRTGATDTVERTCRYLKLAKPVAAACLTALIGGLISVNTPRLQSQSSVAVLASSRDL
eukprot:GHUV01040743.1.p1 GENE.GHUV01040743.1~~GHUV01040743.1.p1  ORF type:complete len:101 (+),score=13.46 GHUV01040743.1:532-834(+)